MISFSLVLACTACPLFCVKWMRSTPYLLEADVRDWMNKMNVFNTFCCWVLSSGCPSRSRRLLSGRRHSRWWCSAHHCWTRINFRLNHDQASQSLPVVNISYLLGVVLVELRHPHTGSWSEHLNNNKNTNDFIKSRLLTEFREKKKLVITPYILFVLSAAITSEDTFQTVDNHFARNKDFLLLEVPKVHILLAKGTVYHW